MPRQPYPPDLITLLVFYEDMKVCYPRSRLIFALVYPDILLTMPIFQHSRYEFIHQIKDQVSNP
jgi:hypothetical protein